MVSDGAADLEDRLDVQRCIAIESLLSDAPCVYADRAR
jgi:hypothetical protein